MADVDIDQEYNQNLIHRDHGGTGPRRSEFMDHQFYVYLAVKGHG